MSRRVDHDRPYTEEEKAYLLTRSNGAALIKVNERKFAHLSPESREALILRHQEDDEKEAKIQEAFLQEMEEDEADSYHPDDVEKVSAMKIADLRKALEEEGLSPKVSEKDKDPQNPMTEKEVLTYRLLNRLDDKRNAAEK